MQKYDRVRLKVGYQFLIGLTSSPPERFLQNDSYGTIPTERLAINPWISTESPIYVEWICMGLIFSRHSLFCNFDVANNIKDSNQFVC